MIKSRHIVIAGGRGFIGTSLADYLAAAGARVTILSRQEPRVDGPTRNVHWDARTLAPWIESLNNADAIVNLVGRSVDCVKTPDHRDEILRSRVDATRVLGLACRSLTNPPPVWVQMSTAHIYGDPPSLRCDEDSPTGFGLAPIVGRAWEEAFRESLPAGVRGVVLRTSFVVGRDRGAGAGALAKLVPLARAGLGGRVASGRQGMSWIHELDMNRLFERGLRDESMDGTYVASSPNPVTQFDFMRELRRVAGGLGALGLALPAFEWMVRIGAPLVLRTDPELAIYGRFVVSRRLREEGFEFKFPTLRGALEDALARSR